MRAFAGATRFQMLFAFGLLTQLIAGVARAGDEPSRVPLRRVVLFTSGVGFFERLAEIDGDVRIDLQFKTDDINDLLQSMVLQDFGGGAIAPVTYASKEPLTRTLETFRIDLTSDPTLADLLAQIRGERVRVETPDPTEGVIVGVELNVEQIKDRAVEVNQTLEKQAREITDEQGRVRANLGEVDKNSELYRRYIRKLTSQEDELEAIGKQVKTLEADEVKERDELGEFILGLDLD